MTIIFLRSEVKWLIQKELKISFTTPPWLLPGTPGPFMTSGGAPGVRRNNPLAWGSQLLALFVIQLWSLYFLWGAISKSTICISVKMGTLTMSTCLKLLQPLTLTGQSHTRKFSFTIEFLNVLQQPWMSCYQNWENKIIFTIEHPRYIGSK